MSELRRDRPMSTNPALRKLTALPVEAEWSDKFYAALGALTEAVTGRPMVAQGTPAHRVMARLIEDVAHERSAGAISPDDEANRYESALNRIAGLGMDAPALGPEPADFYRDQLMTAIGTAARALTKGADR